jgi:branched-chain amino acid aminotransferase
MPVQPSPSAPAIPAAELGFGRQFTPHMVTATWSEADGWSGLAIGSHNSLGLGPAAMVLHYGQAVFEGLKAYRQPDGTIALFRPRDHAARFTRSADRLAMPLLPPDTFVAACEELVRTDECLVPSGTGQSLYLRPFMIATEDCLGVRAATRYLFAVIGSPVDGFFASGQESINVWCPDHQIRAAPGGTGAAKCAGNYAGGLAAKAVAVSYGCDEVLWLDVAERRWIEELSAMNFCGVAGSADGPAQLITPPPGDTILDGFTRRSVIDLAFSLGIEVAERRVALGEISSAASVITEAFACGTAAGVVPISRILTGGSWLTIGTGRPGPVTTELGHRLAGIQHGVRPDEFGWLHAVGQATDDLPQLNARCADDEAIAANRR